MQSEQNINRNISLQKIDNTCRIDIVGQNLKYFVDVSEPYGEIIQEKKVLCCKKYSKQIINGVDVIFRSGQVSAIMGASGAGKSTLLNILAKRVDQARVEGTVFANNQQYDSQRFGDFANYVMQNDILFQTLTVKETLQFASKLKQNLPQHQKQQKLNDLIKNLKLQKCVDVPIGGTVLKGVSGGQKKRTSIAFQLISDPSVIFLDQPTSGLDSLTAFIIVKYLKKLAVQKNKTVIFTIHQPSSQIFAQFDKLILMIEGKIIYQGRGNQTIQYFSQMGFKCPQFHNPSDYFMSIIHHQSLVNLSNYPKYIENYQKKLLPKVKQQIKQKRTEQISCRKEQVSVCTALSALLTRDAINIKRNPIVVRARMMQAVILSLFAGGVFFGITTFYNEAQNEQQKISGFRSIVGALFFVTISTMMSALSPVALTFPIEKQVFIKQRGARLYSTPLYFLSRNLVELPFMILAPLIMSIILYWMFKLQADAGKFFIFSLILLFITVAGSSLGLLIGSIAQDPKLVSVMIPIFILPLVIFGGLYKNRGDYPSWIGWLQYISPNKYGFTALMKNQFGQSNVGSNSLVGQLNLDLDLWAAIGVLIALSIAFRLMSLFFLIVLRRKIE